MQAAAWMSSKKTSGLGASGLMFLFWLLTLTCQTSSNADNEGLANLRQELEILQERLVDMTAQLILFNKILERTTPLEQAMENLRNLAESFPDVSPETAKFQREIVKTIEKTKIRMEKLKDDSQQEIAEHLMVIDDVEEEINEATEILDLIEKAHDEF